MVQLCSLACALQQHCQISEILILCARVLCVFNCQCISALTFDVITRSSTEWTLLMFLINVLFVLIEIRHFIYLFKWF